MTTVGEPTAEAESGVATSTSATANRQTATTLAKVDRRARGRDEKFAIGCCLSREHGKETVRELSTLSVGSLGVEAVVT
jgi:hypothetical protein